MISDIVKYMCVYIYIYVFPIYIPYSLYIFQCDHPNIVNKKEYLILYIAHYSRDTRYNHIPQL